MKWDSSAMKLGGAIFAVAGVLVLILGALSMLDLFSLPISFKQLVVTALIAFLIAIVLIYYGSRIPETKPELKGDRATDSGAGPKQKL